jgi:transcriptional regulator with XRE-family HTH domain
MSDYRDTQPAAPFNLPTLLQMCLQQLRWTQIEFASKLATATGHTWDRSNISKIVNGKIPRPHDDTLRAMAEVLGSAGLENVTAELLIEARDNPQRDGNRWGIPDHWLRLIFTILTLPHESQDRLYMAFSSIVADYTDRAAKTPQKSVETFGESS